LFEVFAKKNIKGEWKNFASSSISCNDQYGITNYSQDDKYHQEFFCLERIYCLYDGTNVFEQGKKINRDDSVHDGLYHSFAIDPLGFFDGR